MVEIVRTIAYRGVGATALARSVSLEGEARWSQRVHSMSASTSVVQRSLSLERRSLFDWAVLRLPLCFGNGGAVFNGQPKTKRSFELKSETGRVHEEFTGFDALFSTRCEPALGLSLIGLLNKRQPRFTVFRQVYRFPAIL